MLLLQATLPFDDSKEQEDEMRRQLRRRNFGERELNIISSESREFEIRGEPVKFLFSEAEDPASDVAYRQITGSFPGKEGVAMLILQVPAEGYEEETFVKMIESIR